jgi:hypothetical protein
MELVPLGRLVITMGKTTFMKAVPSGTRVVIDFAEIALDGDRIHAHKAPGTPAGDWLTIGANDAATLDIRFSLETTDGAHVLVHGLGRTNSAKFSSGAPCWFTPLFETDDPRYDWLNQVQGIARGTAAGQVVTFEVFEAR